jgi:hypothetical protein
VLRCKMCYSTCVPAGGAMALFLVSFLGSDIIATKAVIFP